VLCKFTYLITYLLAEISRLWLDTLLDVIELLPKEIISKEVPIAIYVLSEQNDTDYLLVVSL